MIWGSRASERLLRRWMALQVVLAAGAMLLWLDLMWGSLSRDNETADAVDEFVRSLAVAW